MTKRLFYIAICSLFFNAQNFAQGDLTTCTLFNEANLLKHVKSLSSDAFEGRRTGTKGALKAEKYIINQFYSLKVKPLGKKYHQSFVFSRRGKTYNGTNILGLIEGKELPHKYIVISAHYDHEGIKFGEIYNGADDNASGLSALFSFAEYFRSNPPKHSIILAAFDAEELGLQGSKYFVKNTIVSDKAIVLNINMDMISRSSEKELFVVGTAFNEQLKNIVSSIDESENIKLIKGHDGYDGLDNWTYSSDHANFHKKGIPFLYFGVDDHKDYHEPTDDYENIQPDFYIEAVKTIISVFKKVDCAKY
ncbi:M28 family peptidase [Sabulilitoribacter multivorans]|uniref:M28 family peptidase n=1 Tax=Flaviramulus multivorans TaxID=1304750 RepID=A0ABS9IGD0_9FLAO|nr:M28 family peptidase [Flaviramulus multivorans]MCF7559813.1 M28 family peptidase [Flaviramulus multivorans]